MPAGGQPYPRARDRFADQQQRLLGALDNRGDPAADRRAQQHASMLNTLGSFAPVAGSIAGAAIGGAVGGPAGAGLGMGIGGGLGGAAQMGLGEMASNQMRPQQEEEMRRAQLMQMLLSQR